ncbi:hypothetical protein GCM10023220_65050 [Streptomyces ziwulingensis]|uniref:Uncharacterized protein n=1 Tax=Streptomyces ziwulingensis TaxID=1045501 RepID=A0ABP9D0N1_9ACTN
MSEVTAGKCLPWGAGQGRKTRVDVVSTGGFPVAHGEAEPILRDFLDVMGGLQKDLSRRWATVWEYPVPARPE